MRTPLRVHDIRDVAERQLCAGCGACAFAQPDLIRMVDDLDAGRRPVLVRDVRRGSTAKALSVCPGINLEHDRSRWSRDVLDDYTDAWGPILEIWEGHATDPVIRFAGSSGGVATALAQHCLDAEAMSGVLHIAARRDNPILNQTVLSRSREELLRATGSRYAPASPCDGLAMVADAARPCVFIGKPCDVAAARRAAIFDPDLDAKLGLTIAIFCAGTPSARGTLEMLRQMGIDDPRFVRSIRYRGNGWPGDAEVVIENEAGRRIHRLSYDESWGRILQRHRQWRCHVCADHTGEFADVAVGDPWYRDIEPGEPGRSLVVVRTERGRDIVRAAVAAGTLSLTRVDPEVLAASQPNLLHVRGALWGRLLVCRVLGVPVPLLQGLRTFPIWWHHLTLREKVRSISGTMKRVLTKQLYRRHPVRHVDEDWATTVAPEPPCRRPAYADLDGEI